MRGKGRSPATSPRRQGHASGGGERKRADNFMAGIPETANWELLVPDVVPVSEPELIDPILRPPTELKTNAPVNPRYSYNNHTF